MKVLRTADPKILARVVLVLVVLAALLLFLVPPSQGSGVVFAQASGTAPPGPAGPSIALLNPNPAYDPLANNHQVGSEDIPQISDKLDVDETYHVVAHTAKVPADATGVALWLSDAGGETTIGALERTEGVRNVWEAFWNVPEELDGDTGKVIVRVFDGAEKLAEAAIAAEIDLGEESVELTWPTNGGELGFFKSSAGPWRTVIDGIRSINTRNIYVLFSASARGTNPTFTQCATAATPNATTPQPFQLTCALPVNVLPSQVTSIAVVAGETDNPLGPGQGGFVTQESADVHGVRTYVQDPLTMAATITPVPPEAADASYPAGARREMGTGCLGFDVTVTDHLARPVQGANVDVHIQGPADESGSGFMSDSAEGSSGRKPPEEGHDALADAWDCDSPGDHTSNEGRHDDPAGVDVKHIESILGTGLGPTGIDPGQFRFHVFSPTPGDTSLTAWVDEMPLEDEAAAREFNNDVQQPREAFAEGRGQWLAAPATVKFSPAADSAASGTCNAYRIKVRGGSTLIDGVNVDVHASGPTNDLDFCTPRGGSELTAPDMPDSDADPAVRHQPEENDEASHPSSDPETPAVQHTEGVTDDQGDLIIGLTSPLTGDSSLVAWIDGEPGQDNDEQDADEPSGTGTMSWANTANDAEVRFVNPSGYGGGGDNVSNDPDADPIYHVVTRVDAPDLISGVEILLSTDGVSFSKLGDATRISQGDVWEYAWDTTLFEADTYTLRARIKGTQQVEDREISLDNSVPSAEITQPVDNAQAIFIDGKTTVTGVAGAAAEGVDLFYTITAAGQVRDETTWTACGSIVLPGADQPQNFSGECVLAAGDSPNEVTGIAALTNTCDPLTGCDEPLGSRAPGSGDAHRVFGSVANPRISISPKDGSGTAGTCQRVVISAQDQAGEPIGGVNTDVHLRGPSNDIDFCEPAGTRTQTRSPDQGGHGSTSAEADEATHTENGTRHTEGETGSGGRLVIGIRSTDGGLSDIDVWLDLDDDDVRDNDEPTVDGSFDWGKKAGCTEVGTAGDDVLVGTGGADRLCGRGGDDVLVGKGGSDVLVGGGGNDVLRGNRGKDRLRGGGGRDTAIGGGGNDQIGGSGGEDVIRGGGGNDSINGGKDRDSLDGGPGKRDRCKGGPGRDRQRRCER